MADRVSQVVAEVAGDNPTALARVSQVVAEVLVSAARPSDEIVMVVDDAEEQ